MDARFCWKKDAEKIRGPGGAALAVGLMKDALSGEPRIC